MKRIFDVVVALLALLVLFPIFLAVGVAVAVKLGSPVFFKQVRPGLYGEPFEILKFRTMTDARDENGALLPEDIRLTDFGKWLRSTSLDELPELINVLKGDMSLVGPRPLLMEYLPLYNDFQKQRMEVPPGITGWAQVNGRNAIVWDKKFEYDIWYVKNRTFLLDLKILFLTVSKVFKREGIGHENEDIMPKFKGNKTD